MRPNYHYAPAANWLSDPNGLVHHRGEWHLFYQYNPQGEDWGHMSWGHAVSRDLARWEELPPALLDDDKAMIFSGSAVVDAHNTAGFGQDALVAIYTAAAVGDAPHQSQCLASSRDNGRTWTKFSGNPVLDLGLADFRDPNVFWHEPSGRWIMVVVLSAINAAMVYGSANLRDWQALSRIEGTGAPGEIWECPLLIELPVEGTDETRWLFKVDALHGAPGSGALYRTGTFDGTRFIADGEAWQLVDRGSDFYAAIAWHEPRDALGRPLWIGWIGNHAYQGELPHKGWRGAMSLPRRLSLRREGKGYGLVQQAEPSSAEAVAEIPLERSPCPSSGRLTLPAQGNWALRLVDEGGRALIIERRNKRLQVTRRDPHLPILDTVSSGQLAPGLALTGWLDGGSFELLSEDGSLALTVQHLLGEGLRLDYSSRG